MLCGRHHRAHAHRCKFVSTVLQNRGGHGVQWSCQCFDEFSGLSVKPTDEAEIGFAFAARFRSLACFLVCVPVWLWDLLQAPAGSPVLRQVVRWLGLIASASCKKWTWCGQQHMRLARAPRHKNVADIFTNDVRSNLASYCADDGNCAVEHGEWIMLAKTKETPQQLMQSPSQTRRGVCSSSSRFVWCKRR